MAVSIQAQLKDEDPERSRLANQRSIRALGIVATPPILNYNPRLLERVDDFSVEHSKVQTAGVAVGTRISPRPPHRSRRALLTHRAPPLGFGVEAVTWQRV